jgi:hypothetical protein
LALILRFSKKERGSLDSRLCMLSLKKILNQRIIRAVKSLHYATVKKRSVQIPYRDYYKIFRSGLRTYRSKCTEFNFFLIKFSSVILYSITFNLFIFIKMLFYSHRIHFRALNIIILYYSCKFWDGPETALTDFPLTYIIWWGSFYTDLFFDSSFRNGTLS